METNRVRDENIRRKFDAIVSRRDAIMRDVGVGKKGLKVGMLARRVMFAEMYGDKLDESYEKTSVSRPRNAAAKLAKSRAQLNERLDKIIAAIAAIERTTGITPVAPKVNQVYADSVTRMAARRQDVDTRIQVIGASNQRKVAAARANIQARQQAAVSRMVTRKQAAVAREEAKIKAQFQRKVAAARANVKARQQAAVSRMNVRYQKAAETRMRYDSYEAQVKHWLSDNSENMLKLVAFNGARRTFEFVDFPDSFAPADFRNQNMLHILPDILLNEVKRVIENTLTGKPDSYIINFSAVIRYKGVKSSSDEIKNDPIYTSFGTPFVINPISFGKVAVKDERFGIDSTSTIEKILLKALTRFMVDMDRNYSHGIPSVPIDYHMEPDRILRFMMEMNTVQANKQGGTHLPLPKELETFTKSIINVANEDNRCFLYSLAAIKRDKLGNMFDANRKALQKKFRQSLYVDEAKTFEMPAGFEYKHNVYVPCVSAMIHEIEELNQISIDVWAMTETPFAGFTNNVLHVIIKSHRKTLSDADIKTHYNLLYIPAKEDLENNSLAAGHWAAITNISAINKSMRKLESHEDFCYKCGKEFRSKKRVDNELRLAEHLTQCKGSITEHTVNFEMPKDGSKIQFTNFKATQLQRYQFLADFESRLTAVQEKCGESTQALRRHDPISYAVIGVDTYTMEVIYATHYIGTDASNRFVNITLRDINALCHTLNSPFITASEIMKSKTTEKVAEGVDEKMKAIAAKRKWDWSKVETMLFVERHDAVLDFAKVSLIPDTYGNRLVSSGIADDDAKTPLLERGMDFSGSLIVRDELTKRYNVYGISSQITGPMVNHGHEVILGSRPQKIRFDIDCSDGKFTWTDLLKVCRVISDTWMSIYSSSTFVFLDEEDFTIFSSSNKNKISYHIIVTATRFAVINAANAKEFAYRVISSIPDDISKYIDFGVYKNTQNFRMCGCSKLEDTSRVKRMIAAGGVTQWTDTLIGYTEGLTLLPDIVGTHENPAGVKSGNIPNPKQSTDSLIEQCMLQVAIAKLEDDHVLRGCEEYKPSAEHLRRALTFNYDRTKPGYCKVCKREHDSDNTLVVKGYLKTDGYVVIKQQCRHTKDSSIELFNGMLDGPALGKLVMTDAEKAKAAEMKNCCLCCRGLTEGAPFYSKTEQDRLKNNWPVSHHNHYDGQFIGRAHSICNLNARIDNSKCNMWFHNSNYDLALIMQGFADNAWISPKDISVIACTSEKFKTLTIGNIQIKDSCAFMNNALSSLITDYRTSGGEFTFTKQYMKDVLPESTNDEDFNLLLRKGIYPYMWMDSFTKMNATELPSYASFKDPITDEQCSYKDYLFAKYMWNKLGCKTFADYHMYYNKVDIYGLADVFVSFLKKYHGIYGLDPSHYISLPGFAWDAMLRKTRVKLDQITCEKMYNMISGTLRGGITQVKTRYARANNKYIPNESNVKVPSRKAAIAKLATLPMDMTADERESYIMYFDANNLYGYAMMDELPYGDFQWIEEARLTDCSLQAITALGPCCLSVDGYFPDEVHDKLADLPPLCMNSKVDAALYSSQQVDMYTPKPTLDKKGNLVEQPLRADKTPKLLTTLLPRVNHNVYYRELIQAIKLGFVVTKIHSGVSFGVKAWLKPYIDMNSELRRQARAEKSDFWADQYKLMNNSVFGKTMENVMRHVNCHILKSESTKESARNYMRWSNHSGYKQTTMFADNQWAVVMNQKDKINLDKPIFAGMAILSLSKVLMYDYWYDCVKKNYNDNAKLMYMDTDSFIYQVFTNDISEDMKSHYRSDGKLWYDCGDYEGHVLQKLTAENKGVPGFFKDEYPLYPIIEFAAPRAKNYSIIHAGSKAKKSKKDITHAEFDNYAAEHKHEDPNVPEEKDKDITHVGRAKGINKNVKWEHEELVRCVLEKESISKECSRFQAKSRVISTVCMSKMAFVPGDNKNYICANGIDTLPYGHYSLRNTGVETRVAQN